MSGTRGVDNTIVDGCSSLPDILLLDSNSEETPGCKANNSDGSPGQAREFEVDTKVSEGERRREGGNVSVEIIYFFDLASPWKTSISRLKETRHSAHSEEKR